MKRVFDAEQAIRIIAINEGVSVEEVRKQMRLAMLEGMENPDPAIQDQWKKVPRKEEAPTPEELIAYIAAHVRACDDPLK